MSTMDSPTTTTGSSTLGGETEDVEKQGDLEKQLDLGRHGDIECHENKKKEHSGEQIDLEGQKVVPKRNSEVQLQLLATKH